MGTVNRSVSFTAVSKGKQTCPPGFGHNASGSYPLLKTCTRTRTGSALPNWREVIDSGGNATTSLTATWDTIESTPSVAFTSFNNIFGQGPFTTTATLDLLADTDINRLPKNPTMSTSNADNKARAKFYKRLRELAVQFSGPTFLGELRETLHMIRRPASALYSRNLGYLDALSKRKRASPKHWTKSISGLWLENAFGWQPLMHDIEDAVKAHRRLTSDDRHRVISAGFIDYADKTSTLSGLDNTIRGIYGISDMKFVKCCGLKESVAVRYKGKVSARVRTTQWDNWALFGFTPTEFIPTAWELLPWSFLVDYFTNIGEMISAAVTSTSDINFVNKTVIQKTDYFGRATEDLAATFAGWGPPYVASLSNPLDFRITRKVVNRTANSGISMPTFQLSADLSSGQLLNIAALLGGARALHPQQVGRNR